MNKGQKHTGLSSRSLFILSLIALFSVTACGKVGNLKRPEGDAPYPREYPAPQSQVPTNRSSEPVQQTTPDVSSGILIHGRNSNTKTTTY